MYVLIYIDFGGKMVVIGLSGGSGSGKSTVSQLFSGYNILPINTDEIYHNLTSSLTPCLIELANEFGCDIITDELTLDRARLREIVFLDADKYKVLNTISHKHVLNSVREMIASASELGLFGVIVDAPMLFESGFDKECNYIISVTAPIDLRIKRIKERDGITEEHALKRIMHQASDDVLIAKSDFIIENKGDIKDVVSTVSNIVEKIKNN